MTTLLKNGILLQNGAETRCDILVEDDCICEICAPGELPSPEKTVDLTGLYVSAGFLDMHVHGGDGCDFMDGTPEAFHRASALHLKHGTTAMLPTTLASDTAELEKVLKLFCECKNAFSDGAKLLGVHIEGPYLSPKQSGAQDPRFIRPPQKQEYLHLLDICPDILRWTIAPELDGADEMAQQLCRRGVLPSIGHSDATGEQVLAAMENGFRHITHLYSATSSIIRINGFRHIGIIESAYLFDGLTSEVIADGCHLPKHLLQMAYRFIGPDRLALVTDAMRAAGQTEGESILGSLSNGQRVILEDGVAKMPDRTAFAGSICTADRLVRTMHTLAEVPLADAVKMMTETPARILGLEKEYGLLLPGRKADLVIFDRNVTIKAVLKNGAVCFADGLNIQ